MVTNPAAVRTLAPGALVTVRFGEFLRERKLINDEQWLAALATHWSETPRRRFGDTLVGLGLLESAMIEEAADVFHDGLDVVEVHVSPSVPVAFATHPRPTADRSTHRTDQPIWA